MSEPRAILRVIASLWFAAVLLVLLLVAMACATVFESMHTAEQALTTFYKSWWFELLLALLAVNVAAALVVRYPFSKRQIGFVLTHSGILVILAGAVVTKYRGIDGRVGIVEGQTVNSFSVPETTLTVLDRARQTESTIDLDASVFAGFQALDAVKAPLLSLDEIRVEVKRFLPDSVVSAEVANDNPHHRPAVEVSLSPTGRDDPTWLFENQTGRVGSLAATYRTIHDSAELARLIDEQPDDDADDAGARLESHSGGLVKVEYQGSSFDIPLEDCIGKEVPLGDTGYTVRVLRYLPHATVGPDNKVVSASDRPVNPAIEAEFAGPNGTEKRLAFARFPDFTSMHGTSQAKRFKLTLVAPTAGTPTAPIEVLSGPDGSLYARLSRDGTGIVTRELSVGGPVESPWPGKKFTVLRRFDHARIVQSVLASNQIRKDRVPAVLVELSTDKDTSETWLQKYRPRPVTVDGTPYELAFGDKEVPLGFQIRLDRFRIGYYPGERRPRSFESHITIVDPASGGTQSRVISMNNPTDYGGYNFYQTSYRQNGGPSITYLSVSRDPGKAIVFIGYIATMTGMVVVLITRMVGRGRTPHGPTRVGYSGGRESDRTGEIDLLGQPQACMQGTTRVDGSAARQKGQPAPAPDEPLQR